MGKLLLFDLDGTLLKSDKTISVRTLAALTRCRNYGYLIGVSTSRSEQNCLSFLGELNPDILITSGGALVKKNEDYIYKAVFSVGRTKELIETAREVCGLDCEISIDTTDKHYWNYKTDPKKADQSWGDSIWTDFRDFSEEALKMCVEIFDEVKAKQLEKVLADCDGLRFSDGFWYKYTRKGVTKENSIKIVCDSCGISVSDIIAFGDDYADIGMLKMAGTGVAMGNAIDDVKAIADVVIGSNDEDGIAEYLESI
ncbi:MAG: Cof-type HAD-IIB family hydrolase [Lachnospiraceae bacterium]|nr:Cof-type HAD-IIB family hydrolase [Lachnospiraceae bacterium]